MNSSAYTATIGIECHVQLKTKTKLFAGVDNDAREALPNTLVSHICFGMPGALPVLNKEAVYLAAKAAFALGTTPQKFSKFDRKHYFYPDLPLGYQITQFDQPIVLGGQITINVDGVKKVIGITRAHLEADAGKSTHPAGTDYSLVDLNRAGTPLLEIVSEPDMHTGAEAKTYARELYLRMKYADVSEANLYFGNMRFDVNVSVSKTDEYGTRTETKNINSFRAVEKVVEYEIKRQIDVLDAGGEIVQETRGWDDTKFVTFSQRSKEDAHDYRYFPDPDLPPVTLTDSYIAEVKAEMPMLPDEYRTMFTEIGIESAVVEDIISVKDLAEAVAEVYKVAGSDHARRIAFWLLSKTGHSEDETGGDETQPAPVGTLIGIDRMIKLSDMVANSELSSTAAKDVFYEMIRDRSDPREIAESHNWIQNSDEDEIAAIVLSVISQNEKAAEDVKKGEAKAIGFLVGQVMKQSQGKANPQLAQKLIKEQLGI